ncbi:MAG: DNA polymerase I, partial [Fibrobacterota bacterium]
IVRISMNEKCLYLIDGHALVYRAYYALIKNPLTNSKGQPTGAVYGFANYLLRLIETYTCPYMAVVMDSSKPTFRHEAYEKYKAHREEMPDDLKSQMPLIQELIQAFNLPIVKQDGLEADDLIAILTHKAVEEGYEVFLVTRDKDLMQLLGPKVKMLAPEGTGIFQVLGPEEAFNKMGVRPDQIVDYLALVGDASDNIPGVPGIGPKNAVKILEKAGSVEKILADPSILETPKLISKIEENRERLEISKMLATLKLDADAGFEPEHLMRKDIDREKCLALFRELEFTSLLKNPVFGNAPRLKPAVNILQSVQEVEELAGKIKEAGTVSIDVQATGLLPRAAELVGITFALNAEEAFYIPLGHKEGGNLELEPVMSVLKNVLESTDVGKIGQNLKYDCQILRNYSVCIKGIQFDSLLAAYLIDPGRRQYDLGILAQEWLDLEVTPVEKIIGKNTAADVSVKVVAPYAAEVACLPILLRERLEPLLVERNCLELLNEMELPLEFVLADLEYNGVLMDTGLLEQLSKEYTAEIDRITSEIYDLAGETFNLNSPKQVGEVLFGSMGLKGGKKTKNGGYSTNVAVLEKLADDYPVVQKILEHREKQKLLSTYIDALPLQILEKSGRVHTSFNQAVTATGRLSSTNPNLQNIPIRTESGRKIREAFIADEGNVLVAADYSQIELRILAHLSDDPLLIQAFVEDKDIHTQTASAIYQVFPEIVTSEMRRAAKTINFGLMYGMGPVNLSRQLKIPFAEAKYFIESYFTQFPTIRTYMDSTIQKARDLGYTETLLGRRRYLPEINASNRVVREASERTAINTPVQGTAADIIKIAMVDIHRKLGEWSGVKMLLQVHDELVFEVPGEKAQAFSEWVSGKMSGAYELKVPLKVEAGIGKHWGEAH